jgi:TorA maturation chaperone TorD
MNSSDPAMAGDESHSDVMFAAPDGDPETPVLAEPEIFRANIYLLLARMLYLPPAPEVLEQAGALKGDDTDFGRALDALAAAVRDMPPSKISDEHEELFVGVPSALLMPYASYYLTGTLFGRPLAKLRIDMVRLGIARHDKATEPEDHVGPLFEMMAALILGHFGNGPASLGTQRLFFEKHISDWAPHLFSDLAAAKPAVFYRHVARLGSVFIDIERQAFRMVG